MAKIKATVTPLKKRSKGIKKKKQLLNGIKNAKASLKEASKKKLFKTKESPKKQVLIKTKSTIDKSTADIKGKSPKKAAKLKPSENGSNDDSTNPELREIVNKYDINIKDVQNAINGVLKFAKENPKLDNKLFDSSLPLFMEITAIKIPTTLQKQLIRLKLKHSLLTPDSDVCLIVPDVKGNKNNEHEAAQAHYEEIIRKKGVTTNIKKIMTFHEMRTEYETFELKRGLVELYDIFLVDGRISGKVVHKCGKIFYDKRKVPVSIKLQATNLKGQIQDALLKSPLHLNNKGDCCVVQFGNGNLTSAQLVENAVTVIDQLSKVYPGGFENVRALAVYGGPHTTSIPIYQTLKNPNAVQVPKKKAKKPKAYKTVSGELSTRNSSSVIVQPSGRIIVKKINAEGQSVSNNSTNTKENASKKRKSSDNNISVLNSPKAKKVKKDKKKVENKVKKVVGKVKSKKPSKSGKKAVSGVTKVKTAVPKVKKVLITNGGPTKETPTKIKQVKKVKKAAITNGESAKKTPTKEKKVKKSEKAADVSTLIKVKSSDKKTVKSSKVVKKTQADLGKKKKRSSILKLKFRKPTKKPKAD